MHCCPHPHPHPQVREAAGKGKGLFATRDIAPGELLLVCAPTLYATSGREGDIPATEDMAEGCVGGGD